MFRPEDELTDFDRDTIDAICRYMDDDPTQACLTIVMAHTGDRGWERARLITFDSRSATFEASGPEGWKTYVIPWNREISARPEVREQLMLLWQEALSAFG